MKKVNLKLEEIKDYYYNKNLSASQIAKIFNVSYPTINSFLKKNNCILKTLSQIHKKFDDTVFEKINTEEKAYWLGYLYADGHIRISTTIHKNGNAYNQYMISLTSIDKETIVNFKTFLNSNTKLKKYISNSGYKNSEYYIETVSSEKMYNDLLDKNLNPNKTSNLTIPTNIPDELIHHFIRGYFDGDGSVYISRTKNNSINPYKKRNYYERLCVNIIATHDFCKFLRNKVFSTSSKNIYKERRTLQDNLYYFRFDSKKAKQFYYYIYKDCNICLTRKMNKFKSYLERGSTTTISNPVNQD